MFKPSTVHFRGAYRVPDELFAMMYNKNSLAAAVLKKAGVTVSEREVDFFEPNTFSFDTLVLTNDQFGSTLKEVQALPQNERDKKLLELYQQPDGKFVNGKFIPSDGAYEIKFKLASKHRPKKWLILHGTWLARSLEKILETLDTSWV